MLRPDEQAWLAEAMAATPGPWENHCFLVVATSPEWKHMLYGGKEVTHTGLTGRRDTKEAEQDAAFIASSRNAVPVLCQRLEEERKDAATQRATYDGIIERERLALRKVANENIALQRSRDSESNERQREAETYLAETKKLNNRVSELAEALRERMKKCPKCRATKDHMELRYQVFEKSDHCDLCRKAAKLLEGKLEKEVERLRNLQD